MSDQREFSLTGYKSLIDGLIAHGYAISSFRKVNPTSKHLIVRHDVDMCLDAAVEMATLENQLGVAAHYFVLLRTEMYNLFSDNGLDAVEALLSLGHRVGLHLDASLYSEEELEEAVEWEAGCLQCVTGREVDMISFHRPAKSLLGRADMLAGRRHAYQPKYFNEMAYCSDSRGRWDHGYPLDLEAVEKGQALQLLTHPIWWTTNGTENAVSRLDRFATGRHQRLRMELARNCEPYRETYKELANNDEPQ